MQATERVGSDEARAMRVLLYLLLNQMADYGSTVTARLKCNLKFWRSFASPAGKPIRAAQKGGSLFAFLYDTPANTNNLLPVFLAAQQRGWHSTVLNGENVDLSEKGLNGGVALINLNELLAVTTLRERLNLLASARKHVAELLAEFRRLNSEWAGIIRQNRAWLTSELALAMAATAGLSRLYHLWEPNCVLSTSNLWPFDCAVFTEARRLGIPSFVIQHGVTNHYWWPFVGTKMFLWGRSFENELLKLGAPSQQLAIGGMPASDQIFLRHASDAFTQSATSEFSVVILSQPQALDTYPGLYANYKVLIEAAVAATPSVRWTVKLHKIEDGSFYQNMLDGRFPNFSILPKSTTLETAVTRADVACTLFSTAGLEAMMMRRPLVVFDVEPMIYDYAWWPKFGGGIFVPTAEGMLAFIKQASASRHFLAELVAKQNKFLAENFANPGRAADAILDMISEIAGIPSANGFDAECNHQIAARAC